MSTCFYFKNYWLLRLRKNMYLFQALTTNEIYKEKVVDTSLQQSCQFFFLIRHKMQKKELA